MMTGIKIIRRKFNTFIHNPLTLLIKITYLFEPILSDRLYLKIMYLLTVHHKLHLDNPKRFTEKLQWLKLYGYKPEYTKMVDKVAAKDYVAGIIGKEYVIPTLGVWSSVKDIDWESLPNQFVIKAANDSGSIVICKDKAKLDIKEAKDKLSNNGDKDFSRLNKEFPYRDVPHRYIAEELIGSDKSNNDLPDYKFFCFDGKCRFFKVDFGRFVEHHANYYSPDGKLLPFGEKGLEPKPEHRIDLPPNLLDMIAIAEKLSKGFSFLRVDLYNVLGKIYFGELTFYPASGFLPFVPDEWDEKIGALLPTEYNK